MTNIYIPKYREIITNDVIESTCKVEGEIRLILRDENENVVYDSGWFHNLITNQGLWNMGNGSGLTWAQRCVVGSDATAPAFTDTALYGYMASDQMGSNFVSLYPVAPNYEFSSTQNCRFELGEAIGTIREIGFQSGTDPDNTLLSVRALVSPPVVKTGSQILDVYYRFKRWPEISDVTGSVMIKGESYDYIVRGSYYANADPSLNAFSNLGIGSSAVITAYIGEIGGIESFPTGVVGGAGAQYASSRGYTDGGSNTGLGTGWSNWWIYFGLTRGNGDLRSFYLREAGHGVGTPRGWQIRIGKTTGDGPLPKADTEEMYIYFRVNYARI